MTLKGRELWTWNSEQELIQKHKILYVVGAQWLSGRVLDFETEG